MAIPTGAAVRRPVATSSDAFFRHIVGGMRNGVLAVTTDGVLVLINEEAYRIFGIEPQASDVGRPVATVLRAHPEVVRELTTIGETQHLPNRAEMRLKPSNKVIGYTLARVRNDEGETIGAAMFFKDLTRVEQLEERERLRDRLVAVGQLAAMFAHEVKNPLAAIEVNAGRLRRRIAHVPEAQDVLTDIISEVKMANAIVQEVLEFVRPMRLQVEHTAVARSLRDAIQLADTKADRGGIDVRVTLPADLPEIQADEHQLTQLFTNLLTNAYEAMDGRGSIELVGTRVRLEDGADGREAVRIDCIDDGPGMASDVADRVFEPFFTTKSQGSGLGLAIVRKVVDAHDGRLDLYTQLGGGTTVRVTLPLVALNDGEDGRS